MTADLLTVHCGRHDHQAKLWTLGHHLLQFGVQHVDIDTTIMELVEHHNRVLTQKWITVELVQENSLGHVDEPSRLLYRTIHADLVPNGLTDLGSVDLGDPTCQTRRNNAPRLCNNDLSETCEPFTKKGKRTHCRLA